MTKAATGVQAGLLSLLLLPSGPNDSGPFLTSEIKYYGMRWRNNACHATEE